MSKRRKKTIMGSPCLHKTISPRKKKGRRSVRSLRRRIRCLENSLIQELSYELKCNTSDSLIFSKEDNKKVVRETPSSNQILFDRENVQRDVNVSKSLLDQTIDLCTDESSDCIAQQPKPDPEIVIDLCQEPNEDVIIIDENLKQPLKIGKKSVDMKVINLDEDDNGGKKFTIEANQSNDDILVIDTFKKIPLSTSASNKINKFVKTCIQMNNKLNYKKKFGRENHKRNLHCYKNVQMKNMHLKQYLPSQPESKLGANIYTEAPLVLPKKGLRPIIIDGSNVAYGFHKDRQFSCKRLEICIKYFKERGHKVTAFVPQFRTLHCKSDDPQLLNKMARDGDVILTPSKRVEGKNIVPYDDRFIVQTAVLQGGIIVTRDNYRDLLAENPEWAETINYRTLPYTWVDDILMFPNDPLGENGPSLEEFLRFN